MDEARTGTGGTAFPPPSSPRLGVRTAVAAIAALAAVVWAAGSLLSPQAPGTPAGWEEVSLDPLLFALPDGYETTPVSAGATTWSFAAEGPFDEATGRVTARVQASGDLRDHATVDAAVGALSDNYRAYLPGWQLRFSGERDVPGAQEARLLRFSFSDGPYAVQGLTLVVGANGQVAAIQVVADAAVGVPKQILDTARWSR